MKAHTKQTLEDLLWGMGAVLLFVVMSIITTAILLWVGTSLCEAAGCGQ